MVSPIKEDKAAAPEEEGVLVGMTNGSSLRLSSLSLFPALKTITLSPFLMQMPLTLFSEKFLQIKLYYGGKKTIRQGN
jgi:hypothetical protein